MMLAVMASPWGRRMTIHSEKMQARARKATVYDQNNCPVAASTNSKAAARMVTASG